MVKAWIPNFPKCIVTCTLYFAQAARHLPLKPPIVMKCSVLPPSVTHLWYMMTLVRKHVSINSIQFENNKHHCRNFNWSLKIFYWLLHRPECWLRLLVPPELKILTPAENPNSGRSPLWHLAPWSSLTGAEIFPRKATCNSAVFCEPLELTRTSKC